MVADFVTDPDPVAVTFDLNGHGSFPEGTAMDGDGTATLVVASGGPVTPPQPTDAVYDFAGWFTADGARFTGAVTESTTVYARWVAEDPSVQSPVYSADSVTFNYYGPLEESVYVVGGFNNWAPEASPMAYNPETGYWSLTVPRSSFGNPSCLSVDLYKFVDGSGTYFFDPLNPPGAVEDFSGLRFPHVPSAEWSFDADGHWHTCTVEGCDARVDEAAHLMGWVTEGGLYWEECVEGCGYATEPRQVPAAASELECPDVVCPDQDLPFSFALPEGTVGGRASFEFPLSGDGLEVTVEGGVAYGIMPAAYYAPGEEGFELYVGAVTADGYEVLIEKKHVSIAAGHDLVAVPEAPATAASEGVAAHWACARCGKLFLDGEGAKEVPPADLVLDKLPPSIVEGEGQRVTQGEERPLSFRSNAAFADFICVMVDGEEIGGELYTAEEGSTLVTLLGSFVAGLPAGEHTIGVVSQSGTATAGFTVTEKGDNGDGEGDNGGTGAGDGNGGSGTGDSQGGQDQGAGKTDRPSIPRTADGSPLLPAALLAAGGAALCGMGALAARRGRSS